MVNKPITTSTPNERIKCRPSIKDGDSYIPSPIPQASPSPSPRPRTNRIAEKSESPDTADRDTDYDPAGDDFEEPPEARTDWRLIAAAAMTFIAFLLGLYFLPQEEVKAEKTISLNSMNLDWTMPDDMIVTLEVGSNDMLEFNQPKTFLFAYQDNGEYIDRNIRRIAKNILSQIEGAGNAEPIILEGSALNDPYAHDYGNFIVDYIKPLQDNIVMIVKNIENINGTVAQAFHSICDDFNPLVGKALIFLTVKIEESYSNDVRKLVEIKLRNSWHNLREDDKFYPLFTRITNNVFLVKR